MTALEELPFDDLEPDPPAAGKGLPDWLWGPGVWGRKRPGWAVAVAAVYLLNAITTVLYAGTLPFRPPLSPDVVAWLGIVLGVLAFLAAVGVVRGLEWGRWLGVALAIAWSARVAALMAAWARAPTDPTGPNVLLDLVLTMAVNGLLLWLLLVRWPRQSR